MKAHAIIFINIPFCIERTAYSPADALVGASELKHRYMQALRAEVEGSISLLEDYCVPAIYVGGGSPSVVNPDDIAHLLSFLRARVNLTRDFEVTMETIPQTAGTPSMMGMKSGGVNRVSLLVPAADPADLDGGAYGYDARDLDLCLRYLSQFGFGSLDVRVPLGFAGQTEQEALRTLRAVAALRPAHVTALPNAHAHDGDAYLDEAVRILEAADYRRYTATHFSRPGCACRYEMERLGGCDVFGFGLGARSIMGDLVCTNTGDLGTYLDNAGDFDKLVASIGRLTPQERDAYNDACARQLLATDR